MKKLLFSLLVLSVAIGSANAQQKNASAKGKPASAKTKEQTQPQPPPAPPIPPSVELGSGIPNEGLPMMSITDRPVMLSEAKTKNGLLVMFSCNTCPYVVKAQPRTKEAMALAKSMDIGMVIINSNEAQRGGDDSFDAMRKYADKQGYTVPYVRDDASMMANSFGATRTPEVYLFNGEGKLVYKGALEDNPAEPAKSKQGYLVNAMRALVTKQPISPAETKSIGCSIKRM